MRYVDVSHECDECRVFVNDELPPDWIEVFRDGEFLHFCSVCAIDCQSPAAGEAPAVDWNLSISSREIPTVSDAENKELNPPSVDKVEG